MTQLASDRVTIDVATPSDAMAIANILSQWNAATQWVPRMHSRHAEKQSAGMLVGRGWVTVARKKGRVLGFLARDGVEIHALYLAPHARGQGVGRTLLNHAKAASPHLGLFAFEANEAAQRFYLREGFHEVFRTDGRGNDEGLPDIRFEWKATS